MKPSSAITTAALLSILACAPGAGPELAEESAEKLAPVAFEELDWQLRTYRDEAGGMATVLADRSVTAIFTEGQVQGSAGCNRYFGPYSVGEDNSLSIGSNLGTTQMACAPEVMDQEQRYLAALGRVTAVEREGEAMRLLDAGGETLLAFELLELATLEETEWQATGINNGKGGVVSTASTSLSTAVFANGKVTGSGGCNSFNASFELDGDRITIGPAMSTRKLCPEPEGIMDQEQKYLEALARAQTFTLADRKLELRDADGALQVGFRIADPR